MNKNTLVFVASTKEERYSYKATLKLKEAGHKVYPVGFREGNINGLEIITNLPQIKELDTITLYINPKRQEEFYDYILSLKPKRIIFNPGTENPKLYQILEENNIEFEAACTLVLLSTNQY